jgi:uncharacterized protein YbjT (DUF2867 family)
MEKTNKVIAVTGATGQQGGATAARLLMEGWQVRALVRETTTAPAAALARAGAELVVADMDERGSLETAFHGAYGIFSVQPADEREVGRGTNVAAAAGAAKVQHLVYTSVGGAAGQSQFRKLGKWEIENHLRERDLPVTIFRPAGFMEDFTSDRFGLRSGRLALPFNADVAVQLIAVGDIGAFAALAFERPDSYIGRALEISGDALTPAQIADAISRAIGRTVPYVQVPLDIVRRNSPEAASVFEWVNKEYYTTDIPALRRIHSGLMDFETWLDEVGKERLRQIVPTPARSV